MEPKLKLRLYPGWRPSENPGGPITYLRGDGPEPSALQFSTARPRAGVVPTTSEQDLVAMCEKLTRDVPGRTELSRSSGKCDFGIFGAVAVKGNGPAYMQAWVVSNLHDFILITHICYQTPDEQEIKEAHEIALMTGFS